MIIELPDGTEVEAPDDMPEQQAIAFAVKAHRASRLAEAEQARQANIAEMVKKMPWLERQVAAFGEGARHSIRQAANLLGKAGVPGTPTDEQLREESTNLGPLRGGAPVASLLGGASITLPAAVAAGTAAAPAVGGGLASSVLLNAALGAGQGGVFADPGERQSGTVGGGVFGAALPLVMAGAGKVARPVGDYVRQKGLNWGRRALSGGKTPISVKKPISDEAVTEASRAGAFRPLGSVKGASKRLQVAREAKGAEYGALIDDLDAAGVEGPNTAALISSLRGKAADVAEESLGSPKPGIYRRIARELGEKQGPLQGSGNLALPQAEGMKRTLQKEASSEYDKLLNKMRPTGEAKVAVASDMREAIEAAVAAQSAKAPALASRFEPVKKELSGIIEASNAANEGAARQTWRSIFGLPEILGGVAGATSGEGGGGRAQNAMLGMAAMKTLRSRGPSTGAWGALGLSKVLRGAGGKPLSEPAQAALIDALRRKMPNLAFELQPAIPEEE